MKTYTVEIIDLKQDFGMGMPDVKDIEAADNNSARTKARRMLSNQGLVEGKDYKITSVKLSELDKDEKLRYVLFILENNHVDANMIDYYNGKKKAKPNMKGLEGIPQSVWIKAFDIAKKKGKISVKVSNGAGNHPDYISYREYMKR
jgi:hypothetical protein